MQHHLETFLARAAEADPHGEGAAPDPRTIAQVRGDRNRAFLLD